MRQTLAGTRAFRAKVLDRDGYSLADLFQIDLQDEATQARDERAIAFARGLEDNEHFACCLSWLQCCVLEAQAR